MRSVDFENINVWKNLNEEVLLCKNETFDIVEAKLGKTTKFIVK